MKKFFIIFLIIFVFGCTASTFIVESASTMTKIASGIITWKNGESYQYYTYSKEVCYKAVIHALKKMEIHISKDKNYNIDAGNKKKLKICITQEEKNISKITIRVNYLGDKKYAELIYKQIDEEINIIHY